MGMRSMGRNNARRHVWSAYMGLMTGERRDEGDENCSGGEEIESTILCVERLDEWIMTVLDCSGSGEIRGRNRLKHYVEHFQKLLHIAMGQIICSLYKCIGEWELEDLAFSTDYSNRIEKGDEEDKAMERAFR